MARLTKTTPARPAPRTETNSAPKTSAEPMYFAFVVWGAIISAILYFLGYAYLTFFNREFGIEMEDFSYYEVLLKSYNVIKILDPKLLALIVLLVSFMFTMVLVLKHEDGMLRSLIRRTKGWVLLVVIPSTTLLLACGLWFFFRDTFMTAREAGIIYAQYLKTHLEEQNRVIFVFDPLVAKSIPPFLLEANAKRELRLVSRAKLSYYVMRKPEKGFDPLVYEIPRSKVNLSIVDK